MLLRCRNLVLRRGEPYFRMTVPADLRAKLGAAELKRTIQGENLRQASEVANILSNAFRGLFICARKGANYDEKIRKLADFFLASHLNGADLGRINDDPISPEAMQSQRSLTCALLEDWRQKLANNDLKSISSETDSILSFFGIALKKDGFEYKNYPLSSCAG